MKCYLTFLLRIFLAVLVCSSAVSAYVGVSFKQTTSSVSLLASSSTTDTATADELKQQKQKLLGLLGANAKEDPVLADPFSKEPVTIESASTVLGGNPTSSVKYSIKSPSNSFSGSSGTFLNLLEPIQDDKSSTSDVDKATDASAPTALARNLLPFIPPPLRSALSSAGLPIGEDYIPMRDLFTSPAVSFAYERGWRQGFAQAGFPGPDKEAEMAMEYFEASMSRDSTRVLVDMSCATGLFTRRFAASGKYKRVLGCDYSDSMLTEARRRIRSSPELRNLKSTDTQLDLVRLDVGQIPMQSDSIDALHAGAAMHCWPDLPMAASEIHRVLKPGGRYFATTFLSSYFGTLQRAEGSANAPSQQAFQYFSSVNELRKLMIDGGFAPEKVHVEVLGNACVVIRCEK